jgi:hypothetical protein
MARPLRAMPGMKSARPTIVFEINLFASQRAARAGQIAQVGGHTLPGQARREAF